MEENSVKLTGLTLISATYNTSKVIYAHIATLLPGPGGGGCGAPVRQPPPSNPHPLHPTWGCQGGGHLPMPSVQHHLEEPPRRAFVLLLRPSPGHRPRHCWSPGHGWSRNPHTVQPGRVNLLALNNFLSKCKCVRIMGVLIVLINTRTCYDSSWTYDKLCNVPYQRTLFLFRSFTMWAWNHCNMTLKTSVGVFFQVTSIAPACTEIPVTSWCW